MTDEAEAGDPKVKAALVVIGSVIAFVSWHISRAKGERPHNMVTEVDNTTFESVLQEARALHLL